MRQLQQAQQDQLKSRIKELKRIQKQLQAIHQKTGYEDLQHGVLALQIAEHAVEETIEYRPGRKDSAQARPQSAPPSEAMAQDCEGATRPRSQVS